MHKEIECTCAVDTYVVKSKLSIKLKFYIQMALKLVKKSRIKLKISQIYSVASAIKD